ncbi:MAG: phosphate ABC transporter permease subunit PstC, partial [Cyanobium sp.]
MTGDSRTEAFTLRRRPTSEKLVDNGFRQLTVLLAAMVALILLGIFAVVLTGAWEAIRTFGWKFLTTSAWDPVN